MRGERECAPEVRERLDPTSEVLLQHDGLDADDRRELERLATEHDHVTVAPHPDLPGRARVVATAWTYRQVCRGVDVDALERFVEAHAGKGADS